ncbi:MAG: hypothetical protein WBA93_10265 [Microcoleaceae cyanobacterium]
MAMIFKISRNTLDLWLKREAEIGDFRPITPSNTGPKRKIKDDNKLK